MKDFETKSSQIRQLASMPQDKLIDYLTRVHENSQAVAPNIVPHIHSVAANAIGFLASKLPSSGGEMLQDMPSNPSPAEKRAWLDMHDTVNDPISVLDKVNKGVANPHHIEALQTVYPDLHAEMINKVNEHLGQLKMDGNTLPYNKRVALGLLTGQPIDSTMTPQSMQSIMMSSANQTQTQGQPQQKQKKASGVELDQLNKVNQLDQTPLQARSADKKE